jgi:predicted DCC family thiol-disulfide oxidoreductase YuxK
MTQKTTDKTTVFFDGACHLCSREVGLYERADSACTLNLVDISKPDFDAKTYGLDEAKVNKHMHVRRPSGDTEVGVEAFVAIWEALGKYSWAVRAARSPVLRPAMDIGYRAFARIRPYLPKRR